MTSITQEENWENSSLIGDISSQSAEPATTGSETTSKPQEHEAGSASVDFGTFPTKHQSQNTHAKTTGVSSEVPTFHASGTEGVSSQDSGTVERQNPKPDGTEAGPLRTRKVRIPRNRKAHWQTMIGTTVWRFILDPVAGIITIRKRLSRKASARTITMPELIEALSGQKLLLM